MQCVNEAVAWASIFAHLVVGEISELLFCGAGTQLVSQVIQLALQLAGGLLDLEFVGVLEGKGWGACISQITDVRSAREECCLCRWRSTIQDPGVVDKI